MERKVTEEVAIALIHGDPEYAELLQDFTRVEKDKPAPVMDRLTRQAIERIIRGT